MLLHGGVASGGEMVAVRGGHWVRTRFDSVFRIDTTTHALSAAFAYLGVASVLSIGEVRSGIDARGVSNNLQLHHT